MNLLFITSEGFDTPNSINHLCETLLEDILDSGISVHSISAHKSGIYDDIPQKLREKSNFSFDIIHRSNINKNNFIARYLDEFKYAFACKKIWKKHKKEYDVVLLQSNPCSVIQSILLRSLHKPIILNLYDVFPGHAKSIGVIKSNFVFATLKLIQKILYKNCKYIVAMSNDMKAQLLNENVPTEKVVVINNWFDDHIFETIKRDNNKFFIKYSHLDKSKFYVQFAGLLGYVFDYITFFEVAELLQDEKDVVFLLIGDGNQKNVVLEELQSRRLKNVEYFPWQPLEIISDVYNACDIGFIPLKKGVIGNGVPSKACQLMAAKKVILNSVEQSEYTDLFDKYHMGVNVCSYDPVEIANKILWLKGHSEEMKKMGENAYEYSYEFYSRRKNTRQFVALIVYAVKGGN